MIFGGRLLPQRAAFAALVWLAASAPGAAQDYPSRTVTIIAPAAPGGLYSLFARLIGSKLEQRFGKPFVVENRPGASSIVGMKALLAAPRDGHTLMIANNTGMAVNPTVHNDLAYDPTKDVVAIALIARIPEVLVVNAALPVHTLDDLKAYAKTAGRLSYGSPGAGTGPHLSGVQLASALGIAMTHVPYKGMSPAINDVAGGHIPLMFSPIPFAVPLAQAGKLRMLGVTTGERVEAIPNVPPLTGIGLKAFDATSWFMLVAAAQTPPGIVDQLNRAVRELTAEEGVRAEFTRLGLMAVSSPSPNELRRFVVAEIGRWGAIARKAGLAASP